MKCQRDFVMQMSVGGVETLGGSGVGRIRDYVRAVAV